MIQKVFKIIKNIIFILFAIMITVACIIAVICLFIFITNILSEIGVVDTNYESYDFNDLMKIFQKN